MKSNSNSPFFAIMVSCVLELIFLMFPFWPLVFVATIIGTGFFCTELKWGALSGAISVLIAWSIYFLINPITKTFEILSSLIVGSPEFIGVIILAIFLIGAIFGVLGGIIGSAANILIRGAIYSN